MADTATLSGAGVEALRSSLHGDLHAPGDAAYEQARHVWNGMIDRHPALVARPRDEEDVASALTFAREQGLRVSVRGGGHNVSGSAILDGALVIDMGGMRGVAVDPDRRVARIQGGARLGDVDAATQAHGLALPLGVVSRTGVAGLTQSGGLGFLARRHGLTCDNLLAADVVAPDGRKLRAALDADADLLWALRGGGPHFGVVTSFEFALHPVGPDVWVVMTFYPAELAGELMAAVRDFMADAPEELMVLGIHWSAPDEEPVAPEWRGRPVFVVAGCWSGPAEAGEEALRPLRELAEPVADLSDRMPFTDAQQLFDPDYPDGLRYYWKSIYLDALDDAASEILLRHAAQRPSPASSVDVWMLGGALRREPEGGSAFAKREAPFLIGIEANWDDAHEDAANLAWARELYDELDARHPGGAYLNFPGFAEEGPSLLRASFGANYDRLKRLKEVYDPGHVLGDPFG